MRIKKMMPTLATLLVVSSASALTLTKVGDFTRPSRAPEGLSGITYCGGDTYYAVNDQDGRLYPLTIGIDRSTGKITSCVLGAGVSLAGAADLEGCAFDSGSGFVWASDETGAKITEFDPASGTVVRTAPVPSVFKSPNYFDNYSFEALTIRGDGLEMWTANEEALKRDGTNATATEGALVRLLRFTRPTVDADWTAAGQYAYLTQPIGTLGNIQKDAARSGVSGLCCLPDGTLIVLERNYAGSLAFKNNIYTVDYSAATDVSNLDSLKEASCARVIKKGLLTDFNTGLDMYEGICLGPRLDDGSLAVLLISDSGSSSFNGSKLMSLKLTGLDVRTVTIDDPYGCAAQHGKNFRFPSGTLQLANNPPEVIDGNYPRVGWSLASAPADVHDGGVCAFTLLSDERVVWHYTFTGIEADVAAKWNVAPIRDGAWVETFENGCRYWMTNSAPDNAIVTWASVAAVKDGALVDHAPVRANDWFGDSSAQALRISAGTDEETCLHAGSLAAAVESVGATAENPVYIDLKSRVTRCTNVCPPEPVNAKMTLFVTADDRLACWSALGFATNRTQTVDVDGINRITVKIAGDKFQVRWNDVTMSFVGADGVTRDELPTAAGKGAGAVSEVAITGNAVIDDVYISHGDPANPITGAETATKLTVADGDDLSDVTLTRVNRWLSENGERFARVGSITAASLQSAYLFDKPEWLDDDTAPVEFAISDLTVDSTANEATVTAEIVRAGEPVSATVNGRLVFSGCRDLTEDFEELADTSITRAVFDAAGKVTRTFSIPDGIRFLRAVIAPFESWTRE